jgi:hypothetical protein
MSANGTNHDRGTCDNCGKVGRLGFIVGRPDKSHVHACADRECVAALEGQVWESHA